MCEKSTRIDITGQKFGRLTVLDYAETRVSSGGAKKAYWFCRCECGTEVIVRGEHLKSGQRVSCGCQKEDTCKTHIKDISGQKFGKLTALYRIGKTERNESLWFCECDCGNQSVVIYGLLTSNKTKSCGCSYYDRKIFNREGLIGEKIGRLTVISLNKETLNFYCSCECGNKKEVTYTYLKNSKYPSCGCFQKENRRRGSNHPSYKDGLSSKERVERRINPLYRDWRLEVYTKDNFQCQCCQKTEGKKT